MSNQLTITGRLTRDAEIRYTPSGQAVANLALAHNHRKKSQTGEWVDDGTTWIDATVWGRRAEAVANLTKGTLVMVSGPIRLREFEKRDGSKGRTLEVNAQDIAIVPTEQAAQAPAGGMAGDPWAATAPADGVPF